MNTTNLTNVNTLYALNMLLLKEPNNFEAVKQRALVKYDLRDNEGALADFNRADEIEPNDTYTLCYRALTKRRLNDNKGALEDFNRADEIEPNDAFTLRYRGLIKRRLGDYEGALEDLDRSSQIQPNDAFTLCYLGVIKQTLGDNEGALEDLNKANGLRPNDRVTLHQRAIVRFHLNDFPGALGDILQALNQNPTDEESIEWKNKIEEKIKQTKAENQVSTAVFQEGVIQVPFGELKVIKTLGEGGFGEVSLAEWSGINGQVALKKLKSNVGVDDMSHEAKTLMRLRYKCIVTLMGITTDPVTNNTILIMEYMKHGSLEDLLFIKPPVKLSRASVIRLALDIALGVNYLHSHKPQVIHRDLKSANVLLYRNKTRAKIADFGTAKFLHTNVQADTVIGNALIAMPPEMLAEEIYDEKVDVFAFGVILYEMLTNRRLPILEKKHRTKRIHENIDDTKLRDLVLECCASKPKKRPHMSHAIELLRKMKNE